MKPLARIELKPYEWTLVLWNHQPSLLRHARRRCPTQRLEIKKIAGRCLTVYDHKEFHLGIFDSSIRTLVHELFHVVVELAEYIGMPICENTTEPGAYLLDWMLGECLDAFEVFEEAKRPLK